MRVFSLFTFLFMFPTSGALAQVTAPLLPPAPQVPSAAGTAPIHALPPVPQPGPTIYRQYSYPQYAPVAPTPAAPRSEPSPTLATEPLPFSEQIELPNSDPVQSVPLTTAPIPYVVPNSVRQPPIVVSPPRSNSPPQSYSQSIPAYGSDPQATQIWGMPIDGDGINPAGAEGLIVGPSYSGGMHIRHPYYSYRRPWYTPGPASLNVDIVW